LLVERMLKEVRGRVFKGFGHTLLNGVIEATETLESKEKRELQLDLSLLNEHGLLFTPWNEHEEKTWGGSFYAPGGGVSVRFGSIENVRERDEELSCAVIAK